MLRRSSFCRRCSATTVTFLTELAILALFAASLHLMMGPGGMHSFGHAAYFGLGAYGAALAVKWFVAPMAVGLLAAPLFAGLAGLLFGWFCVRLSGVYLAMLTLAFAQIAWATAFQWVELTGGDNGILGVWPSAFAQSKLVFHYLALALCVVGVLALRHVIFSPFGYALRAGRDSPLRRRRPGSTCSACNGRASRSRLSARGSPAGSSPISRVRLPDLHLHPESRSMRS